LTEQNFISILTYPETLIPDLETVAAILGMEKSSVIAHIRYDENSPLNADGSAELGQLEIFARGRVKYKKGSSEKLTAGSQPKLDEALGRILSAEYLYKTQHPDLISDEPDTSNNGSLDGQIGDDGPFEGAGLSTARNLGTVVTREAPSASPSPVSEFVDPTDYTRFPEYLGLTNDQLETPVRIGIIGDALFESNRFKQADFRKENSEIFQKEGNSWQALLGDAIRALYPTREDLRALLRLVIPGISLPDYDSSQVATDSDYTGISKNPLSINYPNLFTGNVIENFRKGQYPLRIAEYLLDLRGNIASPIVLLRLQDRRVLVPEKSMYSGNDLVIYAFKMRYGQFFEKLSYKGETNSEVLDAAYQDAPDIKRPVRVAYVAAPVPPLEVISDVPAPPVEVIPEVSHDNNDPYDDRHEKLLRTHFPDNVVASRLVDELKISPIYETSPVYRILPKKIGSTFDEIRSTLEALAETGLSLRNMKEGRNEINPNPPTLL